MTRDILQNSTYLTMESNSKPTMPRSVSIGISVILIAVAWGIAILLNLFLPSAIAALLIVILVAGSYGPLNRGINDIMEERYAQRDPEDSGILNKLIWQRGGLTGKEIGGYTLTNMIGKGGMSEIYTAESGGLLLAIKVVDISSAPELHMRFQREIATLESAKHPNIVQVFDSGEDDGYAYMVMEYIDGTDLYNYVQENAPMPLEDVLTVLKDVGAAVDHIHSLDIIHRDLKPGNIMLYWDHAGYVHATLLDFGVATQKSMTVITLEGTVGTIEYMSPEQILSAPMVQHTADVYAVGVMTYNMLTGELPYDGNMAAIMFGHLHNPIPNPRDLNPDLDAAVAKAVMRAMAKEPESRYATIREFVDVIESALDASLPKRPAPNIGTSADGMLAG